MRRALGGDGAVAAHGRAALVSERGLQVGRTGRAARGAANQLALHSLADCLQRLRGWTATNRAQPLVVVHRCVRTGASNKHARARAAGQSAGRAAGTACYLCIWLPSWPSRSVVWQVLAPGRVTFFEHGALRTASDLPCVPDFGSSAELEEPALFTACAGLAYVSPLSVSSTKLVCVRVCVCLGPFCVQVDWFHDCWSGCLLLQTEKEKLFVLTLSGGRNPLVSSELYFSLSFNELKIKTLPPLLRCLRAVPVSDAAGRRVEGLFGASEMGHHCFMELPSLREPDRVKRLELVELESLCPATAVQKVPQPGLRNSPDTQVGAV
jgi:hypothetical protein